MTTEEEPLCYVTKRPLSMNTCYYSVSLCNIVFLAKFIVNFENTKLTCLVFPLCLVTFIHMSQKFASLSDCFGTGCIEHVALKAAKKLDAKKHAGCAACSES